MSVSTAGSDSPEPCLPHGQPETTPESTSGVLITPAHCHRFPPSKPNVKPISLSETNSQSSLDKSLLDTPDRLQVPSNPPLEAERNEHFLYSEVVKRKSCGSARFQVVSAASSGYSTLHRDDKFSLFLASYESQGLSEELDPDLEPMPKQRSSSLPGNEEMCAQVQASDKPVTDRFSSSSSGSGKYYDLAWCSYHITCMSNRSTWAFESILLPSYSFC